MTVVRDEYGITLTSSDQTAKGFTSSGKGAEQLKKKVNSVTVATKGMSKAGEMFMKVGLAALALKLAHSFFRAASEATNLGDQMAKASEKFGVGVERLSALKFAAERAGSSFEAVGTALRTVAKNVSTNSAEFRKWGLELTTLTGDVKTIDQLFLESAELISGLESSTLKAAAAQDIFGRSGTELIPLLNKGAAGIKDLMKTADELGITMSTEFAQQSAVYKDAMLDAKGASQALKRELISGLLPAMTETMGTIKDVLIWWREHKEIIEGVGTALKVLNPLYWAARSAMFAVGLVTGEAKEATEDYELALVALIDPIKKVTKAEKDRSENIKLLMDENIAAANRMFDKEVERGELLQSVYAANALRRLTLAGEVELALDAQRKASVEREKAAQAMKVAQVQKWSSATGQAVADVVSGEKTAGEAMVTMAIDAAETAINTAIAIAMARSATGASWGGPIAASVAASAMFAVMKGLLAKAKAAEGGEIRGGTQGADSVNVLAQRGEGILKPGQTELIKRLADRLEGVQGGTTNNIGGPTMNFNSVLPPTGGEFRRNMRQVAKHMGG